MRFVDDLTKVKPEEVCHVEVKTQIQAIIEVKEPDNEFGAIVIVYVDGETDKYSKDGRFSTKSPQRFIYKPKKVKYLKPLHQILSENPGYRFDVDYYLHISGVAIPYYVLGYFGQRLGGAKTGFLFAPEWIEEREEA